MEMQSVCAPAFGFMSPDHDHNAASYPQASGVNRFVRTLALLTLGLCLNYRSRMSKLSQAEAAAMVVLDQLKSAELATNYRTGFGMRIPV